MKQSRSVQYYQSVKDPKQALRGRMREIAQTRVRYGYRRIHVLLKREGWQLGKNQAYRLYSEEQLQLRSKLPKRRKMVVTRQAKIKPAKTNEAWSMDFVADQLANGMKFRTLTIVDVFSKEALAIEVGQRLRSEHVVAVLNRLAARRSPPNIFLSITAANSRGSCSICGRTITRHGSTSAGPENQRTIATLKRLTDHSGTSA